jgi:hypothetical protein
MSAKTKTMAVVDITERKEEQAAKNLEKVVKEFMGGIPYELGRMLDGVRDDLEEGGRRFFNAGLRLLIIQQHEGVHARVDKIIDENIPTLGRSATYGLMKASRAIAEHPNFASFLCNRGGYTKILTIVESCSEEEILRFDESGEVLGLNRDTIANMSGRQLRKIALRAKEKEAQSVRRAEAKSAKQLADQAERILDLEAQIPGETPADAALALIQRAQAKILDGFRMLANVAPASIGEFQVVRDALYGLCETGHRVLDNLSVEITAAATAGEDPDAL